MVGGENFFKNMPQKKVLPKRKISRNKRQNKYTRASVLKMLAVMEASQAGNAGNGTPKDPSGTNEELMGSHEDFLMSGRTGRRNAMPDILGTHASTSSSDLPSRLENLTTEDRSEASTSGEGAKNQASTSTKTNS